MTKWIKENWLLIFGLILILTAAYGAWHLKDVYEKQFNTIFPGSDDKRTEWGVLGDFFGGFLNPIFSFLGLIFLLATLFLNQKELELSRNEFKSSADALKSQAVTLEKQRFEDTFFALLNQHNLLLEKNIVTSQSWRDLVIVYSATDIYSLDNAKKRLLRIGGLNQYFRVLYQLLKFIASNCPDSTVKDKFSCVSLEQTECSKAEKFYSNIIRSFLSENIYYLLAINCYCQNNDDKFIEYKRLLERYAFFEHMRIEKTPALISTFDGSALNERDASTVDSMIKAIIDHYDRKAFGNNLTQTKFK